MVDEINACVDIPDERDYPYEMLAGAETADVVKFPDIIIQDQSLQEITKMACTRYGMSHIVVGQKTLLGEKDFPLGIDLWKRYLKVNPSAEVSGATLQSALKQAKDEGLIAGYAKINSRAETTQALSRGHFIFTGSHNGNWIKVRDEHLYSLRTDNKVVGHIWDIVERVEKGWRSLNSRGEKNGYFFLPDELFDTTFTKYAIIPTKEIDTLAIYRKNIMEGIKIDAAKAAFENGIWSGQNPQAPASREEVAAMIQRALNLINK